MEKWIEVNGKMMDSVEFTRFIRQASVEKTRKIMQQVVLEDSKASQRLKRLQEQA